jgi:serine/threonine-protein kinase
MELLEGETLRDRIKRGPLDEADAIHICTQIADAVAAAHRQQIIHRDLKPENVFLTGKEKKTVKILDFGIAKLHDTAGAASVQTQAGVLLGTPSYMSPEQCMGRAVDRRTDVYALGIILFEMCTGRVPFTGEGYADLLIKQISADLPSPRSINPALSEGIERVMARALEKDPAGRFQSMEEFMTALAAPQAMAGPVREMPSAQPGDQTVVGSNISTTLSGATGEVGADMTVVPPSMQPPPSPLTRKSGGGGMVIGIVAMLLAVGGGVGYVLLRDPGNKTVGANQQPQQTTPEAQQPVAAHARLHISSDPVGAEVRRKDTGEVLGVTPLDKELPADGSLMPLVVHKDGYKDGSRGVVLSDRDATLAFRLVADPGAAAAPGATPTGDGKKPATPVDAVAKPKDRHHHSGAGLPRPPSGGDEILAPNLN